MQNCFQTRVKPILLSVVFLLPFSPSLQAQENAPDLSVYRNQVDSLYQVAERLCNGDSTSRQASSWVLKSNSLLAILDDPELRERFKHLDLHTESARALIQLAELDKKKIYQISTDANLVSSTLDLANLGLEALETSRTFNSPADAEKAAGLFSLCLETYKQCGKGQASVDRFWKEDGLSWQWIRFFKAVASRKAGKKDLAEKEYGTLIKIGWNQAPVFLELADLLEQNGKPEDARKMLIQGHEAQPGSIPIACALTRSYLKDDQLKKAQALIRQYDEHLGFNSSLVLTKALVYEKKGDFKKADALFKAVHKSDSNEVEINSEYAGYLIRKAKEADPMDADEFSQQAYTLLHHASELSPENARLKSDLDEIKAKYPKVKLEEPEEL